MCAYEEIVQEMASDVRLGVCTGPWAEGVLSSTRRLGNGCTEEVMV